jgi:hypothetical protein
LSKTEFYTGRVEEPVQLNESKGNQFTFGSKPRNIANHPSQVGLQPVVELCLWCCLHFGCCISFDSCSSPWSALSNLASARYWSSRALLARIAWGLQGGGRAVMFLDLHQFTFVPAFIAELWRSSYRDLFPGNIFLTWGTSKSARPHKAHSRTRRCHPRLKLFHPQHAQ